MIKLPCSTEQWPEFSALLYAALELPPEQRAAWLDSLQPEHAHLRRQLAEVLAGAALTDYSTFLETPRLDEPPGSEFVAGQRIGIYTLEHEIGRGGMGEVWLASRSDNTLSRRVALKLPHAQFLAGALRKRFERERDILASLSHPYIAALYDAGVSEGGHPYLAMEWVDGVSITSYCRETRTSLQGRLTLFQRILEAVHYAHGRLIAHRDLKPANILVTRDGQVKLLDFGIAKLLTEQGGEAGELTLVGGRAITPAYAAPEQRAGRPVTTAVDLYALGVILFELLCGTRPFPDSPAGDAADAPLASRRVSGEEAVLVGGLSASKLSKLLEGDLDAVLVKALEPDPAQRYRSAEALAEDIGRYQRHEPVSARHIGRLALAAKFVRRHRSASVLTAGLILAVIIGGIGTAVQAVRAERESTRAELAAQRAENAARRALATKDFLVSMFKVNDPRTGPDKPRGSITAKELMDLNSIRITQDFAGDPEVEIELLGTTAEIYSLLDESERALQLGKLRLELLRSRRGPTSPEFIEELIEEADQNSSLSRFAEARATLQQADAAIKQAGLDRSAHRALWLYEEATASMGDPTQQDRRITELQQAVQLYREVAPRDRHLGYALGDLGGIYFRRNDFVRAQEYQRQSIAVAESEPNPDAAHLTSLYSNQGKLLVAVGDLPAAQVAFGRARELVDRTYGSSGRFYWTALSQQARTLHLMGERDAAMALFRELLRDLPAESQAFHNAEEEVSAARAREAYGSCLLSEGRARMAAPVLSEAAREFAEAKQDPLSVLRVRALLGEADAHAGRIQEAGRLLSEVVAAAANFKAENPTLLRARLGWARYLFEQGKLSSAEQEFKEVLRSVSERHSYLVALSTGGLAQIATARHDAAAAVTLASQAVEIFDHIVGYRDVRMGPILWLIRADAALLAGDAQGALDWAQRALDADRRYDDPASPDIAAAEATLRLAGARLVARTP